MPHTDLSWRLFRPAEGFYSSEVAKPKRLPVRTFLPTGYEPNYAYPLLVFFHGEGGNDEQILRLAPRFSRRNLICISLRGPEMLGFRKDGTLGYSWGRDGDWDETLEEYVLGAIEKTRRSYHVHSERIYLTGFCEGATLAYRLGLKHPGKFGGIVSLNGTLPPRGSLFLRLDEVRGLGTFIGHGFANATVPLSMARADQRLLYTAGLDVQMQTYPTTHKLHPHMLRDVNRWIIERCNQ
jgi:phospholipase/carboxylesterase